MVSKKLEELKIPNIYNIFEVDCKSVCNGKHEEYCSQLVVVIFDSKPKSDYLPFGEDGNADKNQQEMPQARVQTTSFLLPKEFILWKEEMLKKQVRLETVFPAVVRFGDFPRHVAEYITYGWNSKYFFQPTHLAIKPNKS